MKSKNILCLFLCSIMLLTFTNCSAAVSEEKGSTQNSAASLSETILTEGKSTEIAATTKETSSRTVDQGTTEKQKDTDKLSSKKEKPTSAASKTTSSANKRNSSSKAAAPSTKPKKENSVKLSENKGKTTKQKATDKKVYTCTISIECSTILNNTKKMNSDKLGIVPSNGVILSLRTVKFTDGETVYDVLERVCRENNIHMEASWTGVYNSAYIEGIGNIYEFDCGAASGWKYCVNGWYPNYGCSRYQLKQGDSVEWRYTCNYGKDLGSN